MQMRGMRWLVFLWALCVIGHAAGAAPTAVLLASDTRVTVGQQFVVEVRVEGASDVSPLPVNSPGLQVGEPSVSRQSSAVYTNGRLERTEKISLRYVVIATETGDLSIGPIEVMAEGQRLRTNAMVIRVTEPQKMDGIVVDVAVNNPTPYVGEPVELDIVVLSERRVQRGNFQLTGEDTSNIDVYDAVPAQNPEARTNHFGFGGQSTISISGVMREGDSEQYAIIMKRIVVPRRSGVLQLGPLVLAGEQEYRRGRSVFDAGTRQIVVPSDPLSINVKPLPEEGKPQGFTGLIGNYDVFASAIPQRVSVGQPIELSILIKGAVLPDPVELDLTEQAIADGFKLADRLDPPEIAEAGQRFTLTIRAMRDDVEAVPPIELPYFDTQKGEYVVARSRPIPITVEKSASVGADDLVGATGSGIEGGREVEDFGEGIAHNYDGPDVLTTQGFRLGDAVASPLALAALGGPPIAYGMLATLVLVTRRRAGDIAGRRRRDAAAAVEDVRCASGAGADVSAAVSEALYRYMGARFDRSPTGLTPRECEELLAASDVNDATRFRAVLERCDEARFGGLDEAGAEQLQSEALSVLESVDAVLRRRRS